MSEEQIGPLRAFSSSTEADDLGDGRRTSRLAATALILSFPALLGLFHPLLLVIPLLSAVLAAAGMRAISANPTALTGRGAALVALSIAMLILGWSPARTYTRTTRLYAQAEKFGVDWIKLLSEGRTKEAHQLRQVYYDRAPPDEPLDAHYSGEVKKGALRDFINESGIRAIIECGANVTASLDANLYVTTDGPTVDIVGQRYSIQPATDDGKGPLKVEIELVRREFSATGESHWEVRAVRDLPR